jgi:hypothetical protein
MSEDADLTKVALSFVLRPEPSDEVKSAFQKIGRAPLALAIDQLLSVQPGIAVRPQLLQLADLNQGRLEDLDAPDFISYIVTKTGINEFTVRKCAAEIKLYQRLSQTSAAGQSVSIAARNEEGQGAAPVSLAQVLEQLKKRVE